MSRIGNPGMVRDHPWQETPIGGLMPHFKIEMKLEDKIGFKNGPFSNQVFAQFKSKIEIPSAKFFNLGFKLPESRKYL